MFDIHCPTHGCRVLLGSRSIEAFTNTAEGIVLRWRCHCGTTGTELVGARVRRDPRTQHRMLGPAA